MRMIAICIAMAWAGCAAAEEARYTPVAGPSSVVTQQGDATILVSSAPGSRIVVRAPNSQAERHPAFMVAVLNDSAAPLEVSPENISFQTADGRALPLVTEEALQRQYDRDLAAARASAAMRMANNSPSIPDAYAARDPNATRTQTLETSRLAASRNNAAVLADEIPRQELPELFERRAIAPGDSYLAPVLIDSVPTDATGIVMIVTVGQARHELRWSYARS